MQSCLLSIGKKKKIAMAKMVSIRNVTHLYWKGDKRRFVTMCENGDVIFEGKVMTLCKATSILLREVGVPPSFLWDSQC